MKVKIKDVTAAVEQFAPLALAEGYDNPGLIVGHSDTEIESALLCVDITEEVMDEAEELGVRMVISHHPIIFHPLRKLTGSTYVQRVVERAIKSGIALYASHTNLDAVKGGMSYRVAQLLGMKDIRLLSNHNPAFPDAGFGVTGELQKVMPVEDFFGLIKQILNLNVIRYSGICSDKIRKVALCTGSGASLIDAAWGSGADIYIAADFKYNDFLDATKRITIADIGHFESEYCAIDLLFDVISKKLSTFTLHKSQKSRNPINYSV